MLAVLFRSEFAGNLVFKVIRLGRTKRVLGKKWCA